MYHWFGGRCGNESARAALEAFILLVVDLERADHDVAVLERFVLAREVGVVKAGHAVMIVHEVVVEFTVGVVPKLVVRVDDRLVIVEDFERLGLERLAQAVEGGLPPSPPAGPRIVVEVDPDEAAELHLAAQPAQADVLLAQPVLKTLLLAADIDAVSAHVVLPCMEHAGHPLRIARRLAFEEAAGRTPLDDHAAMRADVEERAHLVVGTAAHDDRLARNRDGAEVVCVRQFGFVADGNPGL